jgi:hypothetical protein
MKLTLELNVDPEALRGISDLLVASQNRVMIPNELERLGRLIVGALPVWPKRVEKLNESR